MTPERAGELAVRATGVVVVVSVAVALAALTWRLTGWDDGRDRIVTAEALPPRTSGPDPDVARILALAPFGGGPDASGLPASALGLVLKGILLAVPADASQALIATGDGGQALIYGVGAAVAGDAVIEAIEVDRVILRTGAGREVLGFPPPVAGAVPDAGSTPGAGIFITPPPGAAPTPAVPGGDAASAAALAMSSPIASAQAAAARAAAPAPPPSVPSAADLGATPAAGGGYRIGANPSPELRRLGVQPGDVIETLNGEAVGNVANDRALAQRALASGGATVIILREGRRVTLTIPLR